MILVRWFSLLSLVLVAGCADGPDTGLLIPLAESLPEARTITLLAATTRTEAGTDKPGVMFTGERGSGIRFATLTISVPPERKAGDLPLGGAHPDPKKQFALVSAQQLSLPEFMKAFNRLVAARAPADRRALVFTHGYNTQFDEAAFRFSQIVEDTGFRGVPILFSWPSRGEATDYGYDRDSAIYSRDALELLLTGLGNQKSIASVDVFAHSMGNWLTLETLRQASIARNTAALGKLGRIVLAAPDVDMDVFRTQVSRMGPLAGRFLLYASGDDQALRLSRALFGGMKRAGENTNLDDFRKLGIEARDLSKVEGGFGKNHDKAFGDDETVRGIGDVLNQRGPVETSQNAIAGGFKTLGKLTRTIVPVIPGPKLGE